MTNDVVSRDEFVGAQKLYDERFGRDQRRIEKLEDAFTVASNLDVKLGVIVERLEKAQADVICRVTTLEQRPVKRWEAVVGDIVKYIVAIALGLIAAKAGLI